MSEVSKIKAYLGTPFSIVWTPIDNGPGHWNSNRVEVFRDGLKIGEYERNYSLVAETFYPFQFNDHWYAFYSSRYTATRVARLTDKFEDWWGEEPSGMGFCPTEFWVPLGFRSSFTSKDGTEHHFPTWFDSDYKTEEEFSGEAAGKPFVWATYGFLSGCYWGDDSSWKLRYIDFSEIENKVVKIQERFGYWELGLDIRQSVRITGHNSFHLLGLFRMDLNKSSPNENFVKGFFGEKGEEENHVV